MKKFLAVITALILVAAMSVSVFAATTELLKDGTFPNGGFVNAGEVVNGTVQGPGNWTQINCGDYPVDAPYLHVIVKATGNTANAQIAVSDTYTFKLADLGITLTEEYQDVVLPVQEKDIPMVSWVNFMGLDGGSSVYTVKEVFLSDSAAPTISAASSGSTQATPKTGSSDTMAIVLGIMMIASLIATVAFKKKARA
ncbi:MAG: LPXTG cell wall anchor domain-containing protein [Clostridiaceae bacterium]|nr:LPXTG cell wall anchor domain-containing protein [Clostridiaceae bacterium]